MASSIPWAVSQFDITVNVARLGLGLKVVITSANDDLCIGADDVEDDDEVETTSERHNCNCHTRSYVCKYFDAFPAGVTLQRCERAGRVPKQRKSASNSQLRH